MWAVLLLMLTFSAPRRTAEENVTDLAVEERLVIAKGILKVS